ncbi:MAG: methyltransferase domain-containing protein [Thermodesulfobacteriota bacterium]
MVRRYPMRPHDWASFAAIAGFALLIDAVVRGSAPWAIVWAVGTVVAGAAARHWSRKYPAPMPSAIRWVLHLSPHAPRLLLRILQPKSGEHVLEIGPGIGHHALAVAPLLLPGGTLDVLDLQQEMLDAVARRAAAAGVTNVVPRLGSAHELPYADATFDGAYLSAVLGEIPDQPRALRELRRVLKPNGRLVIAEVLLDPDFVSLATLRDETARAGFGFETKAGSAFAYLARFRPA